MQSISSSINERKGGNEHYLIVLVQVSMCDWHLILIMYYFRPYRSVVYFDFVHLFLQRSGTLEFIFTSSPLQSPGVTLTQR